MKLKEIAIICLTVLGALLLLGAGIIIMVDNNLGDKIIGGSIMGATGLGAIITGIINLAKGGENGNESK